MIPTLLAVLTALAPPVADETPNRSDLERDKRIVDKALKVKPGDASLLQKRGRLYLAIAALGGPRLEVADHLAAAVVDLTAAGEKQFLKKAKRQLMGDPKAQCKTTLTRERKTILRHKSLKAAAAYWIKKRHVDPEMLDGGPTQICGQDRCHASEPSPASLWDGNTLLQAAIIPRKKRIIEIPLPGSYREYQCMPEGDVRIERAGTLLRIRAYVIPPLVVGVDEEGEDCDPDDSPECERGCGDSKDFEEIEYLFNPKTLALMRVENAPLDYGVEGSKPIIAGCKLPAVR